MKKTSNRSSCSSVLTAPTPKEYRTFIIYGLIRGGTSMVAGVLRGFGLDLGSDLPDNHEDPRFVTHAGGGDIWPRAERNVKLRETITARNAEKAVWGWKYPEAADYVDDIIGNLRNPHLICVFRDLASVTLAHERWHSVQGLRALNDLNLNVARNISLLSRADCPKMMISYEKALRHPDNFAKEITEFCGIDIDPKFDYRGFMQPEVYKKIEGFVA